MGNHLHIINARIYPMENEGEVFFSMEIKEGRVVGLGHAGSAGDLPDPHPGIQVMDLGGKTILPGFTDAHCHFIPSAVLNEFGVNISGIKTGKIMPDTMAGVGETLKQAHQKQGKKLILGFNLVTAGLAEKRMPALDELDAWLPGKITIIMDSGGHSSAYSSKAIEALGLEEIHENGLLIGRAHEFNMGRVNRLVMKQLNLFSVLRGICTQVNRLHDRGITAIHCMEGFDDDPKDISTRLFTWIAPVLPLHIRLYCQYKNPKRVERFLPKMACPRLGGCGAWEMDGAVSAGTAAFYGPYKHPEDTSGECYYADKEIDSMVARADARGFQISAHAIGPRAIEPLLTALENRTLSRKNPLRHRIEHFEFPSADQAKRAVDSNIILVPQPGWTWMDSQYQKSYAFHLTDSQFQSQIPLQDIVSMGGILCGSSDSPVQDPDPMTQLRGMCDFPVQAQSISRWEALRAFTINGAWAGFEEKHRGSLAPGKMADFIVLNQDVFDETVPLEDLRVEQVFMAGKTMSAPSLTPLKLLVRLIFSRRRKI